MNPIERSERSKKAWRSRKRQAAALGHASPVRVDRGGAQPPARDASKSRVGYAAVLAATTPDKSSAQIGAELGLTAAAVRTVWRRAGLPRRPIGKRPAVCASTVRPTKHEPRR